MPPHLQPISPSLRWPRPLTLQGPLPPLLCSRYQIPAWRHQHRSSSQLWVQERAPALLSRSSAGVASRTWHHVSALDLGAGTCVTVNSIGLLSTQSCGGGAAPFPWSAVKSAVVAAKTSNAANVAASYFVATGATT